jgi:O-methyltransferase
VATIRGYIPRPFGRIAFFVFWDFVTLPATALALFVNPRIDKAYGMSWRRRIGLVLRFYANSFRIITATSFKAHLAMAVKLLELPPSVSGAVVECGCFRGGSSANLSIICDIVGRELILYDSFEGLPQAVEGERFGDGGAAGAFRGELEQVRRNIDRCGVLDVCTFRKGWLADTLPDHTEPIALCFVDVDYEASLYDCIANLWPHLVHEGYVFIDEYVFLNHCALFFSERFWRETFDTTPPGLIGAGTGVPMGNYYLGPFLSTPPLQTARSIAYTRKHYDAHWVYYPD